MPSLPVVILTAHGTIQSAVEAMRAGAYDYLTKPFDNDNLLIVVNRALERALLSEEVDTLKARLAKPRGIEAILGESSAIQALRSAILRIAPAPATVLIEGPSGSGKELVARAIHDGSPRRDGPFVAVNCAAIPAQLAESEFFGHEKGAFTGADVQRRGKFEEANGGSLFLDEIAELSLETQSKVLRVLQEKEFPRVGGSVNIRVDVRVIAATNRELEAEVGGGGFREDLFYRLNVVRIRVPALREHPEDIGIYARHFLARAGELCGRNIPQLSDEAMHMLTKREWRGNVRELENAIHQAVILAPGERLEPADFAPSDRPENARDHYDPARGLAEHVRSLGREAERRVILEALRRCDWNRTRAAQYLKISRRTLFSKMEELGLESD